MSRLAITALLLLSSAFAQSPSSSFPSTQAGVIGGGQPYAMLSSGAAWQTIEVPLSDAGTLDRSTLKLTAPGLTLKITGSKASADGRSLQLAIEVQRAAGFQNGAVTFTLQDGAGQGLTFRLSVY
jgi:hypothetical protein